MTVDPHPDEVYGREVIEVGLFPANDGTKVPSVTTTGAPGGNFCYWLVTLPEIGEVWCPTQLGPLGTYCEASTVNPFWWRSPGGTGNWTCIHGDLHGDLYPRAKQRGWCDGTCGTPDVPPTPVTQDDVDAAVKGLLNILHRKLKF